MDRGLNWDSELPYIDGRVRSMMHDLGERLVQNPWCEIAPTMEATYQDEAYDAICFTDASAQGWGALVRWQDGYTAAFQQRWVHNLPPTADTPEENEAADTVHFTAKHSAHAEPQAITHLLKILRQRSPRPGQCWAVVTDHLAIVRAQRKQNGYGGIGRGYALNKLFELTNALKET
eukprot:gene9279-biopygen6603